MLVHLTTALDVGELAMIKSLLDGNGIVHVIHDEHVSSLYPGVPFLGSRVLVEESEHDRASTLLRWLRLSIREAV